MSYRPQPIKRDTKTYMEFKDIRTQEDLWVARMNYAKTLLLSGPITSKRIEVRYE